MSKTQTAPFDLRAPEPGGMGVILEGLEPFAIDSAVATKIKDLVYEHKFVALRGIELSAPEFVTFASHFGRPEPYHQTNYHHPEHPEIFVSSNVAVDGKKVGVAATGQFWHTDYSFMAEPLSFTTVYPQIIPEGKRGTKFIDMGQVLRELPDDLAAFTRDRRAFHDATNYYKIRPEDVDAPIIDLVKKFRAMSPGTWHPMMLKHPVTGEELLYMSEGFTMAIEGQNIEANAKLLPRFFQFMTQEKFVRTHWVRQGDLMMWDNRGLIHHAAHPPEGGASLNFRISLYDELPFYTNPITRELPHDVYCDNYLATRQ